MFFRVDNGVQESGEPIPFDARPPLTRIREMFDSGDYYLDRRDGSVLTCWVDSVAKPQRARLGVVRRTDLPEIEEGGNLSPLELAEDAGLAERVHLAFFPDNVLGADFNSYGPRPTTFAEFHNRKLRGQFDPISIDPLLAPDVTARLARLEDIRLIELKVKRAFAAEIQDINASLGQGLEALAEIADAQTIHVTLSGEPYSRDGLGRIRSLKALARRILRSSSLVDDTAQLRVRGYDPETESVETVDLLKSQILTQRQIVRVRARGRTLDSDDAYRVISEAYRELRQDIREASAVS
jgi:hypothetical protein